jgi:hypothetical protein
MAINRRQLLTSLGAGLAGAAVACRSEAQGSNLTSNPFPAKPLRLPSGEVDWAAVRALFPLSPQWTHLASFLLASHPKPVADAIDEFRRKLDAEPGWIEDAAFVDSEGHPFAATKKALADYVGGTAQEICVTPNTTTALAVAYQGLRIRPDQRTRSLRSPRVDPLRGGAIRRGREVRRALRRRRHRHIRGDDRTARPCD